MEGDKQEIINAGEQSTGNSPVASVHGDEGSEHSQEELISMAAANNVADMNRDQAQGVEQGEERPREGFLGGNTKNEESN